MRLAFNESINLLKYDCLIKEVIIFFKLSFNESTKPNPLADGHRKELLEFSAADSIAHREAACAAILISDALSGNTNSWLGNYSPNLKVTSVIFGSYNQTQSQILILSA